MPEVLFVSEVPAPQLAPTLDMMVAQGMDLAAVYHVAADTAHGWGDIIPEHHHETAPGGVLRSCLFLARRVLGSELKVLCCFGYHRPANVVAILLARFRGVQVVTRSDSNWLQEAQRPRFRTLLKKRLLRLIFGTRTRVWTIGTQNDRYWAEMGLSDRHLITFGSPRTPVGTAADGAAFRDRHRLGTGMVVLYVGVLEPWKGIDTLLDGFRSLPIPSARLVVVGQGSLGPLVERAASQDDRIVYCGAVPQASLGAVYAAADVLVLASHRDAWGLVVDEAQVNGLRVVLSDAVGCGIDRVDATNGWIFTAGRADELTDVLATAAAQFERGWPPLPRRQAYDSGPDMVADLVRLGVSLRVNA